MSEQLEIIDDTLGLGNTADVPERQTRFKDASWFPTEETPVLVGGAGGIGSWLTVMLERAGFAPYVFDFDTIEVHNLGGQLLPQKIGETKVKGLQELIKYLGGSEIDVANEAYVEGSMTNNYVFSAFDNMKARKDMFAMWKEKYATDEQAIFIDGRLTMEQLTIFCVKGGDTEKIALYETEHLFDDSEVEDAPCTMKQTSHSAAMIASHMTGFFTNFISLRKGKFSSVPFSWEYYIPTNMVKQTF